jgi:hypothetical protein
MRPQTICGSEHHVPSRVAPGNTCALHSSLARLIWTPTQHTATYQTLRSGVHRVQRSALATTPAYQNRANLPAFIEQLGTQRKCRAAGPRAALRSWTELGAMCTALSQPLPRTKTRTMFSSSCTAYVTATNPSVLQINDRRCLLVSTAMKSITSIAYWSLRRPRQCNTSAARRAVATPRYCRTYARTGRRACARIPASARAQS